MWAGVVPTKTHGAVVGRNQPGRRTLAVSPFVAAGRQTGEVSVEHAAGGCCLARATGAFTAAATVERTPSAPIVSDAAKLISAPSGVRAAPR